MSGSSLAALAACADHTWIQQLRPDPEAEAKAPNKSSRQVKEGHFVPVTPTPLPNPRLVAYSPGMAAALGISTQACGSDEFLRFFSGDAAAVPGFRTWCTPYALSIYGQPMTDNCPFKNGNGYGDGRAVSVGEVTLSDGAHWEFQLKGGGTTPFCRGGDGRAVLRSSVREFLVQEAMYHMGVSTTRSLSLIVSGSETVQRPWYSNENGGGGRDIPKSEDDPRLQAYPPEMRRVLLAQLEASMKNPDVMQAEQCAITCRVAPSFMRVGHIELHARRAASKKTPQAVDDLKAIWEHAIAREFQADVAAAAAETASLSKRIIVALTESRRRITGLTADWIRVGFCQGNFNSDNCLVGGRTMDYGPFGFMEKYDPAWNMWSGGGEHFSFGNQPVAGFRNFVSLVQSAVSVMDGPEDVSQLQELVDGYDQCAQNAMNDARRRKMGLLSWSPKAEEAFEELESAMKASSADYTLFWRQLATAAEHSIRCGPKGQATISEEELLRPFADCFYTGALTCDDSSGSTGLSAELRSQVATALRAWSSVLTNEEGSEARSAEDVGAAIRAASPKYVPREWMLVDAYTKANNGDFSVVKELQELFAQPYAEQPQMEAKYYRKATPNVLKRGGTAFMT